MTTATMPSKPSIPTFLTSSNTHWHPRLVANVDKAYDIKIAKLSGAFIWHVHPEANELFYILHGELTMEIEQGEDVVLAAGDMFVVPKGVRHRPVMKRGLVEAMLIEKAGTVNTGNVIESETTVIPDDVVKRLCSIWYICSD
jgi:mannose-6-phosphate isomerase-like protein (cupin superfamily)